MAKYEGMTVVLAGEERVLPPLTLRSLRRLTPQLKALASLAPDALPNEDQITAVAEVVHASMIRNYPDVTLEQVEEMVDLGNLETVISAVMSVAGLEKRKPGAGEA